MYCPVSATQRRNTEGRTDMANPSDSFETRIQFARQQGNRQPMHHDGERAQSAPSRGGGAFVFPRTYTAFVFGNREIFCGLFRGD
jgi:hypothetical protein